MPLFFSFRRKKQSVASGVKRKFWEVKLPEFPPQPLKKRRIENKGLRLVEKCEKVTDIG